MALSRWQRTIVNETGDIQPFAQITVLNEETQGAAAIYADRDGNSPLAGGVATADASGFVYFYVKVGRYRIQSAGLQIDWRDVEIGGGYALLQGGDDADFTAPPKINGTSLTILIRDSLRQSVEAASGGRQTVLYTAKNQPNYVTIIPKYTLDSLNAGLGSGVHPGFIVNGVEKTELFVGTYQGRVVNDELLSLPGVDPTASQNFDWFVQKARAAGPGWHLITNAEWAAIALWCRKNGFMPNGNNNYGRDHAAKWETGRRQDGRAPGESSGSACILTGSGPNSWRHDNSASGISDLNGNIAEWTPGLRLMDGEIQIIPNNDAALPSADFSSGSSQWRAILASDGSLVAPGTAGTLKYDSSGESSGSPILSDVITNPTGAPGDNGNGDFSVAGAYESVTTGNGISAPNIAKILGLYPHDTGLGGDYLYVRNGGERLPYRGGSWYSSADAGLFYLRLYAPRTHSTTSLGSRPAFVI